MWDCLSMMSLLVKLIYYVSHQMMENLKEIEFCHFSILLDQLGSILHLSDRYLLVSLQDYMMQQTMLRVKNPATSLDFYTRVLGMTSVISQFFLFFQAFLCGFLGSNHLQITDIIWYHLRTTERICFPACCRRSTSHRCDSPCTSWVTRKDQTSLLISKKGQHGRFPDEQHWSWRSAYEHGEAAWFSTLMINAFISVSDSNWGSELDQSLSYHNGNKQPLGFGETLTTSLTVTTWLFCQMFIFFNMERTFTSFTTIISEEENDLTTVKSTGAPLNLWFMLIFYLFQVISVFLFLMLMRPVNTLRKKKLNLWRNPIQVRQQSRPRK